jgi:hypothetical protein
VDETRTYHGRCHCGGIRFHFSSPPITRGLRCNCGICLRKGAVMSTVYFAAADFVLEAAATLEVYRYGDLMVNHYFCRTCGIYPFHDTTLEPGHYRVNLGCLDDLDVDLLALPVELVDGKSL